MDEVAEVLGGHGVDIKGLGDIYKEMQNAECKMQNESAEAVYLLCVHSAFCNHHSAFGSLLRLTGSCANGIM